MREVDREFRATAMIREREHNERAWLAWHIVALDRVKKFPDLEKLLIRPEAKRRQTPEEQEAALKALFLAWGGNPEELRTLQ